VNNTANIVKKIGYIFCFVKIKKDKTKAIIWEILVVILGYIGKNLILICFSFTYFLRHKGSPVQIRRCTRSCKLDKAPSRPLPETSWWEGGVFG